MADVSRREFLKLGAQLAAVMGLGGAAVPKVAEALEAIAAGTAPVLWLQGQSCSGCSVSLLNTESPTIAEVVTGYISLRFHSSLSTATGHVAMDVLNASVEEGSYILVAEGAVPADMPEACSVGGEQFNDQIVRVASRAKAVVAVGACAAFGGIPAAEGNPTGAMGVPDYLAKRGVSVPIVRIPGCPAHPDWLVGTLVHVLKFGMPRLDRYQRPEMFFGRLLHDQCPRFRDYEAEHFATTFGDEGCYFKLGCVGPKTYADCSLRLWNSGANFCINAGAPCIGCAWEDFAAKRDFPFVTKLHAAKGEDQ